MVKFLKLHLGSLRKYEGKNKLQLEIYKENVY